MFNTYFFIFMKYLFNTYKEIHLRKYICAVFWILISTVIIKRLGSITHDVILSQSLNHCDFSFFLFHHLSSFMTCVSSVKTIAVQVNCKSKVIINSVLQLAHSFNTGTLVGSDWHNG